MLTGEGSLDAWMRGLDPTIAKNGGSGRGARNLSDVPRHRYDTRPEPTDKKEIPADKTNPTTGEAKIGGMVVRNTITGELRTLDEVWTDAKNAHYTTLESGKVVAVKPELALSSTPLEKAMSRIVFAPQIDIAPWAVGEAFPVAQAA